MNTNKNTPKLRFKGFTDDWEQRKLGSILIEYIEKNPGNEYLPVLTSSRQGLTKQEEHFGSVQRHDISDYNVIPLGFCTYRNRSDDKTFTFNINRIVPRGLVSKFYPVFDIKNGNADFVTAYLNNNIGIIKSLAVNAVGTSQVVLSLRTLKNIEVILPSKAEQDAIGNYIRKLNICITLYQGKLEKLKLAKKALLQKLFPKHGSQFPEIRFKGFTDDWEQRKLSDITEVIMGQSPSSKNYTDNPNDNILVQGNADLKDGKVIPRLWTKEITKTIDKDGIILTVRAPVGDVAKTDYKVVLGRGVAGIKGNDYIYHFLQKLQNNQYWVSLSSGSTFESINSNDIKDLIIDIPSIEEQTKISILLNNVNSIITLHQRKLDRLISIKKGLLQQLFV